METINYLDKLIGVTNTGKYDSGETESISVNKQNKVKVNNNIFVPRFSDVETRRKDLPAIRLYKNGNIKSIDLENQTKININKLSLGAEKVIFYENGNIKKIFPLNGRISGYWSEQDEYELADYFKYKFTFAELNNKIISVKFYEDKSMKSVTLWPKEVVNIRYKNKIIRCKTGFSIYKNGNLMSCEPSLPFVVKTPIGDIEAFDKNSIGITGDNNSLKFDEKGNIKELITSTNIIKIIMKNGKEVIHSPQKEFHFVNSEEADIITIKIQFKDNNVIIDDKYKYRVDDNRFIIEQFGEKTLFLQ